MKVGALIQIDENDRFGGKGGIGRKFEELAGMGMQSCQVVCWSRKVINDPAAAEEIRGAAQRCGVSVSAFWCGWEGPCEWNFYEGQETLGLVPPAYRFQRTQMLKEGSDFAKELHVGQMATHVGFLPENPHDPNYAGVLAALREIVRKCRDNGQIFLFETGQETPVTLKRAIQDIGYDNVGINLDPANLVLYGKANPVDALDVFGEYVLGIHGKDGLYPTDGHGLGREVPLGEGKVDYPRFLKKLREIGYRGDITIEREITGEEQRRDILNAKKLLEDLIAGL